ncbi:hypothetical protein EVAR_4807_1 [Eumeta japonica]|uniref:Uncharacterized protein n=1 Tax=Eumeta variegata TaxID=151549 RepID=A0A4C1T1T7_EUMVA|nr:hypothetical protein EVAR_4807_1 [Eumeta japonica]
MRPCSLRYRMLCVFVACQIEIGRRAEGGYARRAVSAECDSGRRRRADPSRDRRTNLCCADLRYTVTRRPFPSLCFPEMLARPFLWAVMVMRCLGSLSFIESSYGASGERFFVNWKKRRGRDEVIDRRLTRKRGTGLAAAEECEHRSD